MDFSILMVCTGNICRSPMAEGLLRHHLPEPLKKKVSVASAGTHGLRGNFAEPFAVKAAAAHGADIRNHRARPLDTEMVKAADLVLVMEGFHLRQIDTLFYPDCPYVRLLGSWRPERTNPEIADPYGRNYAAYEKTAQTLMACLPGLMDHIREQVFGTDQK